MPFDVRDFPGAPPEDRAAGRRGRRWVAIWLFSMAAMVLAMIVLGGVTRLTGSGLSIMEWAPLSGALPPTSDAEWQRLYLLYQQIPQYALVNEGMSLAGFKGIFWLEWTHRLLGRVIGVAFILPLLWFWATDRIGRGMVLRLGLLFVLGALQGAVGWFMVASGFDAGATSVSPYRLVIHLTLALVLYAAMLWTGMTVLRPVPPRPSAARPMHRLAWWCCLSVALTMLAGGFVAGTHAGLDYNTFPLMDGRLVPKDYASLEPFTRNLTENVATVQFDHRLLATMTMLVAIVTFVIGAVVYLPGAARLALLVFLGISAIQYLLGVATLVLVVPTALSALHQLTATLVLTAAIVLLHTTRPYPVRRAP